MNLKLIDAAIASYEPTLSAGDKARLAFFRSLWEVQSQCAREAVQRAGDEEGADAAHYQLPDERELLEACKKELPVFAGHPVRVSEEALAKSIGRLVEAAVGKGGFSADVVASLSRVKWDRVVRASNLELAGSDPSAWLADFCDVLVDDGAGEAAARLAALIASMALRVQLEEPARQVMGALRRLETGVEHPLLCPVCGSAPALAHVGGPTSSSGRGRLLICTQCGASWEFDRVRCARCGTHNQAHLHFFNVEGDDAHRLATCDECGGYIRTLYSEEGSLAPCSYEVEDVVMARLDAIAQDPRVAGGSK